MHYIIYLSSANKTFSDDELKTLLELSRKNNMSLGITGMLLYSDGNFIQVIEGELNALRGLYSKISLDKRHHGIFTLLEGELETRNFPDWSMGFKSISKKDYSEVEGYRKLSGSDFNSTTKQHPALVFLKNFMKINTIQGRYAMEED